MKTRTFLALGALLLGIQWADAQGTTFTYQGRLTSGTNPANGSYDLTFALFSVNSGPGQVSITQTNLATIISNGLFTVELDFGANFPGDDRWLEIGVRTNGSASAYTTLSPRQPLTPTPYAIYAGNAAQVGGQAPTAFVAKAGDTMTGTLNLPANGLAVGASQLVTSGGNVGIGTASPQALLNVNGTERIDASSLMPYGEGLILNSPTDLGYGGIHFHNAARGGAIGGGTIKWSMFYSVTPENGAGGKGLAFIQNNANTRLYLGTNGNVGIGTTSPGSKLHVGDETVTGSQGMIRLGSRTTSGNNVGRTWEVGVPETGDDTSGAGYSFVVRDLGMGSSPQFMVKYGSGNVGIGTTNPASKLVVVGDFDVDATPLNATFAKMVMHGGGPISFLGNANDRTLYLGRNGAADVTIQAGTGNVGIGTTTPGDLLCVKGGALSFEDMGNPVPYVGLDYEPVSDALRFRANLYGTSLNTTLVTMQRGGNVGIGTTNPASKLVVVGDFDVDATPLNAAFAKMVMHGGGPISFLGNANDRTLYLGRNGAADVAIQTGTGNVGIGALSPQAKLEIQGGADQDGSGDPYALSLAYRYGGYRHWISTRHNGDGGPSPGNAFDFYLNTSSSSAGSSAPGVGNAKVMTLDAVNGVKAIGGLVIETRTGSDPASPAPGRIWLRTDL